MTYTAKTEATDFIYRYATYRYEQLVLLRERTGCWLVRMICKFVFSTTTRWSALILLKLIQITLDRLLFILFSRIYWLVEVRDIFYLIADHFFASRWENFHFHFLSISDDMLIKLWNWEKSWSCQQVFEGHTHYVMQIVINPKDNNTFVSASLDRTLKVKYRPSLIAFMLTIRTVRNGVGFFFLGLAVRIFHS